MRKRKTTRTTLAQRGASAGAAHAALTKKYTALPSTLCAEIQWPGSAGGGQCCFGKWRPERWCHCWHSAGKPGCSADPSCWAGLGWEERQSSEGTPLVVRFTIGHLVTSCSKNWLDTLQILTVYPLQLLQKVMLRTQACECQEDKFPTDSESKGGSILLMPCAVNARGARVCEHSVDMASRMVTSLTFLCQFPQVAPASRLALPCRTPSAVSSAILTLRMESCSPATSFSILHLILGTGCYWVLEGLGR